MILDDFPTSSSGVDCDAVASSATGRTGRPPGRPPSTPPTVSTSVRASTTATIHSRLLNHHRLIYSCLFVHILLVHLITPVHSIAIDNDVVGEPEVQCLQEQIRFTIRTRKLFAGRMYAKSKVDVAGCMKSDFQAERTTQPHWDIPFGNCGMKSLRSIDPRGMYYGITVVVSFHTLFITKVDQAFHVKCFFEETNKGLTAELGVSMIPTTEVLAKHTVPGCVYSMHKSTIADLDAGRAVGDPIKFARVGDKVLHQWSCDDPMFGVLINNCYVTDGFGQRAEVVDNKGCPIDPILITGIRYSADIQKAYAESHVFKFADKPGVWFFCQIQMCMKAAGMCQGVSVCVCAHVHLLMLQPPVCDGNAAATIGGGGSGGGAPPQPPLPTGGGGSPPQSPPPQPAQPSGAEFGSPTDINSSGDYGSGPVPNAPQPPPQAYTSAPASGGGYGGGSGGGSGGYASSGPSYTAAPFPNTPYSAQTFKGYAVSNQPVQYPVQQLALTPFGPAYPPQQVNYETPQVNYEVAPQGVPLSGVSRAPQSRASVNSVQYEQSDAPGVGLIGHPTRSPDDRNNTGGGRVRNTVPPKDLNVEDVFKNLPKDMQNDKVRETLLKNKQDQRFLQNALYRARNAKPGTTDVDDLVAGTPTNSSKGSVRGEKIKSIETEWLGPQSDDPTPEIAGQLIIFDLDEDPPNYMQVSRNRAMHDNNTLEEVDDSSWRSFDSASNRSLVAYDDARCVISARGLLTLTSALAAVATFFALVTTVLCMRQCKRKRTKGGGDNMDYYEQQSQQHRQHRAKTMNRRDTSKHRSNSHHTIDPRFMR